MNKFFQKTKSGFTLVELLIVIIIIAVLAGVVLVAINPAQQRNRATLSTMKSNVASICSAQAVCLVDNPFASCLGFGTTAPNMIDVSNPYSAPGTAPTSYVASTGAVTMACSAADIAAGRPCLGVMAASPFAIASQVTIDSVAYQMTCHNDSAVVSRGATRCTPTSTAGANNDCTDYRVN